MIVLNKSWIFLCRQAFVPLLLCMFSWLVCGCSGRGSSTSADGRVVTVSVPPLEYFVNAIGGDSLTVRTLMDTNSDPETFQPGMGLMKDISRSDLVVVTGVVPFEKEFVSNITSNVQDLKIGDAGRGVDYMYGTHVHSHQGEVSSVHSHKGEPDPHIWSSVKNARIISDNVYAMLSETYPGLAGYFHARHELLRHRLDSLDAEYERRLAEHPAFVIWHPSLSYFARDYGLEQIAFNLENKETSPIRLREATDNALEHEPSAFFVPEGLPLDRVATISDILGVRPTGINFMDSDWEGHMEWIVNTISPVK